MDLRYALLLVAACSRAQPAEVTCAAFDAHVNQLTRTPSAPSTDHSFCMKHTVEQRRCAVAAKTVPELMLCTQFGPERREIARTVQASIQKTWPGSVELAQILHGTTGCAFEGVVGAPDTPLNEQNAAISFATRGLVDPAAAEADGVKPIGGTIGVMVVALNTEAGWRCAASVPDEQCAMIERECKPR